LKGDLDVIAGGGEPRITGEVESLSGWVELLGRRYTLERVRVGFDGSEEVNPELDVRVTRQVSEATIVIEVHGTAKKPQLVLASEPPVYDQSQIIGIILSGDPGTQRTSDRTLDQQVTGAIS